jgi:hypothetical protein
MTSKQHRLATSTQFQIESNRLRALFKKELCERKRIRPTFEQKYNNLIEFVGDPLNWPENICSTRISRFGKRHVDARDDMRRMLITPFLKHSQRFKITLFLLSNGVPPVVIQEFYDANNSLRDNSAKRSIKQLYQDYANCTNNGLDAKWCTFDLIKGRWENLNGTINKIR